MNKIFASLLFIVLSSFSGLARANITYTLPTFAGAFSTLKGSITVDHTGTLSASDIMGFSFSSNMPTQDGLPFSISGPPSNLSSTGGFTLIATPTSLAFSYPQDPGNSTLGVTYKLPGETLEVTFVTGKILVTEFADLIIPAQISWGESFPNSVVISGDSENLGQSGSTVIGLATQTPLPSPVNLMGVALVVWLRAHKRQPAYLRLATA